MRLHNPPVVQIEEEEKDEKQLAEEEQHKLHWHDFWKHYRFWSNYAPALFTFIMFTIGTSMYIWKRNAIVAYFQVPLCHFFFLGTGRKTEILPRKRYWERMLDFLCRSMLGLSGLEASGPLCKSLGNLNI